MRRLYFSCFIALLAALLIAWSWKPVSIEERLVQLQVEQLLPEYADELSRESLEIQALFIDYAQDPSPVLSIKARLALLRYPEMARPIFSHYGAETEFQNILRGYGEHIIPPIHYFLMNEIRSISITRQASNVLESGMAGARRLWGSETDTTETENTKNANDARQSPADPNQGVSPEERGWSAVMFIQQEGHDFLGQFVLDKDGQVTWVQTERVLEGLNAFFAGGVRGLETKYRRDEAIEAGDVGWAALDVAIGISALKVLRLGRASAAAARTTRTARTTQAISYSKRSAALGASLLRGSAVGLRLAKYGAPIALAYIAVRHPSVLNAIFGGLAQTFGLSVLLIQILGWTLVLLPIVLVLQFLRRPVGMLLVGAGKALRWSGNSSAKTNF